MDTWSGGLCLARNINYQFPQVHLLCPLLVGVKNHVIYVYLMYLLVSHLQFKGVHLSVVIPSASDDAVNLIAVSTNRWPMKLFTLDLLNAPTPRSFLFSFD